MVNSQTGDNNANSSIWIAPIAFSILEFMAHSSFASTQQINVIVNKDNASDSP